MSEWQEVRIGDVCKVGDGAHTKVARQNKGVLYLTSKNFDTGKLKLDDVDFISEEDYERLFPEKSKAVTRLQPNDILMGIIGTFGNAYKYQETDHFGVSSSVAIIRPNSSKLSADFLVYLLNSEKFKYVHRSYSSGSVQGYSNIPTIKQMPISLPSVQTQEKIVAVLKSLDRSISNLRRQNETLEAIAQTLFKHWFIDFEFPNADGKPYKSSGGKMERSELGEIPAGWRVGKLNELITVNPRETIRKGSNVKYVDMKSLSTSSMEITDYIFREFTSGSKFRNGDTLLARITPCLENGKTAFVNILNDNEVAYGSTEFIVMRSGKSCCPEYVYCLSRSEYFRDYAIKNMTGSSGRQRVPNNQVEDYEIAIPELSVVQLFHSVCKSVFLKIESNQKQIQTLAQTRDVLLPKLMSGKLRVKP